LTSEFRAVEVKINPPLTDVMFVWPPQEAPNGRVGIEYEVLTGQGLRIMAVTPDGPAHKAGLQLSDLILEVDGVSVSNITEIDLRPAGILGERDTVVVLTIKRGDLILKISVTRGSG
jgi:C-terminal processing protease CtpA/Prc